MLAVVGNLGLIFSFIAYVAAFCCGVSKHSSYTRKLNHSATILVLASFAILVYAYLVSDFSILNVYQNSHLSKPLIYKITGVWGNHEGSMLLWMLITAFYISSFQIYERELDSRIKSYSETILSAVGIAIAAYVLFASNPFDINQNIALDGMGMNPVLQDIAIIIHPPMLYFGYIGFSVVFALGMALLIRGNEVSRDEIITLSRWTIVSWCFLTGGIVLGGWWAYRELGWGGYWFWDPVENASLFPWMTGTALFHSLMVAEKRMKLFRWVLLLTQVTFILSLLGTFLVRSGLITSVHSFATDPKRGLFILSILSIASIISLGLYSFKAERFRTNPDFAAYSKENILLLNNILLCSALTSVLLGTIYPMIIEILGMKSITIGAPYFNYTFLPIMIFAMILAGLGVFVKWRNDNNIKRAKDYTALLIFAIICALLSVAFVGLANSLYAIIALTISLWLVISSVYSYILKCQFRLRLLPARICGMHLAHAGLGVMAIGITISSFYQVSLEHKMAKGSSVELGGYVFQHDGYEQVKASDYVALRAKFKVSDNNNNEHFDMNVEKRFYNVQKSMLSEASIDYSLARDVYIVIGGVDKNGSITVRFYIVPFVSFIWIGAIMMVLGGALCIPLRRAYIGAL